LKNENLSKRVVKLRDRSQERIYLTILNRLGLYNKNSLIIVKRALETGSIGYLFKIIRLGNERGKYKR